jgi:hypothetical protein
MRRRVLLGSAAAVGAAGLVGWPAGSSQAATTGAQARGGSNYGWYQIDDGCNREPYGVVKSFHKAPDVIRSQLAAMRAAGQARLRIHIIHRHRADTGTAMDSTGGNLSAQNRQNLSDLLRAIADAGFAEIQVTFMPIGENDASTKDWNKELYQENRDLIYNLRPIIAGAGIQYRIDLCNEAVPTSDQPVLLDYARRLWNDYTHDVGMNDTCGFSTIGFPGRIAQIPQVYGKNPPYLFDFHFYRRNTLVDEGGLFTTAHNMMNQFGYTNQGWTISEAFYNDSTAARTLRQAIDSTGRTVFYLLQWPVQAPRIDFPTPTCPDATAPTPPVNFAAYTAQGF